MTMSFTAGLHPDTAFFQVSQSYVQLLLRTTSRNGLLHKTMNMNPPPPVRALKFGRPRAGGACNRMAGQTTKPEDKRLVVLQEKAAKGNATAQNEVTTASHFASKHRLHRFSSGMCSFVLHDLALLSASQHCPLARFPPPPRAFVSRHDCMFDSYGHTAGRQAVRGR